MVAKTRLAFQNGAVALGATNEGVENFDFESKGNEARTDFETNRLLSARRCATMYEQNVAQSRRTQSMAGEQNEMKCIILTMTSGEGHNNTAKALAEQFAQTGVESEIVDIFKNDGFEYRFNSWGYLFVCKRFPRTYDFFWKKLKFRNSERRYHGIAQKEVDKIADDVAEKVRSVGCDFFVCVHPYCAMLCDKWKRQGKFADKKAVAILTDVLPHPLWESAIRCDYVLTPTTHGFEQLRQKGFATEQLCASGFPVASKFAKTENKQDMRKALGLQNQFTVMIASGGFGIGENWKVAKRLAKLEVQILCVNGKNKRAFAKTQKLAKKQPNLHNFGFVNNVDELMSCADVIVSRGGAATLFEAMTKRLPVIVREKAIINERENAEILQREGAAIALKKLSQVEEIVKELQNDAQKLESMQNACAAFAQGDVQNVCAKILDLVQTDD